MLNLEEVLFSLTMQAAIGILPRMENDQQQLNHFKQLIPTRISVQVVKDDAGIYAQILDLPHCYTQASNVNELPEMITDLVFTHFEVPEAFKKDLGEYIPLTDQHLSLEEAFRNIIEIGEKAQAGQEVKSTFTRTQAVFA